VKNLFQLSLTALLTTVLVLSGCSKSAETGNKPAAQFNAGPAPAISAPPENPVPPAAPPVAVKKAPRKERPKAKPPSKPVAAAAEANPPQEIPAVPEVKTPPPIAEVPPAPVVPSIRRRVTLDAGTLIPVRTIDAIDSRTDKAGQMFHASLDSDIAIEDEVVVPKGADATLKLVQVSTAGKLRGKSELQLQLVRLVVAGQTYTVVSNIVQRSGAAEGEKTVRDIGIGAAIGAAIGAIAGGGKGAAIGAGVGAGGGAAAAAVTEGEQVVVPSETLLEFRLEKPIRISIFRGPTD
jgi:hypothetical protein